MSIKLALSSAQDANVLCVSEVVEDEATKGDPAIAAQKTLFP